MRKFILPLIFLLILFYSTNAWAPVRTSTRPGFWIQEEDGSPARQFLRLKVPNDSLTNNADGSASIDWTTPLDSRYLMLDCSNDPLTNTLDAAKISIINTSEPAITISMTGVTGTDNQAIDIVGGEALGANEHQTFIRVKPDDIDPSGADTRIRGVAINLSGVDVSNVPESMDGLRINMPAGRTLTGAARSACDAISIDDGDVDHFYSVPNTAAAHFTAYDFVVDSGLLHANSEIHTIDIAITDGTPAGDVVGLGTHSYISPIHQHIGTYTTPDQTTPDAFAGHTSDGGSTWTDGIDGNEIFKFNSDIVWIGSAAKFSEIEVIMTTDATKQIGLTFEFSTGAATWSQFYPSDDTDGFQQSGLIHWDEDDLTTWSNLGDPGAGDSEEGYWIRITRTSTPDPGTPTPTTMKTGTITLYSWDKDGDVDVLSLEADTITEGGVAVYNDDEMDTEGELETILTDVTNMYTDGEEDTIAGSISEGAYADQSVTTDDIKEGTILSGDLSWDAALDDGDYVTYDSTGTNFAPLSPTEVLSELGGIANDWDANGDVTIVAADISDTNAGTGRSLYPDYP